MDISLRLSDEQIALLGHAQAIIDKRLEDLTDPGDDTLESRSECGGLCSGTCEGSCSGYYPSDWR